MRVKLLHTAPRTTPVTILSPIGMIKDERESSIPYIQLSISIHPVNTDGRPYQPQSVSTSVVSTQSISTQSVSTHPVNTDGRPYQSQSYQPQPYQPQSYQPQSYQLQSLYTDRVYRPNAHA